MAKKKLSTSAKIRNLLEKGLEPQAIAKRLDVSPAYVHTIKWSWKNKGKKTAKSAKQPAEKTTFTIAEKEDGTQVVFDHTTPGAPFNDNLEQYVRDLIAAQVTARVQNIFEGVR